MNESCETCDHWKILAPGWGHNACCQARPQVGRGRPATDHKEWCGQWTAKTDEDKPECQTCRFFKPIYSEIHGVCRIDPPFMGGSWPSAETWANLRCPDHEEMRQ